MIDRRALVERHNPRVNRIDRFSSLSVGNGEFAMTVDATGLQSFPDFYNKGGVPLGTMSNWGWHESPNPSGYSIDNFPMTRFHTFTGREINYPYSPRSTQSDPHTVWLRNNPHRLHLGLLQFRFHATSGHAACSDDIHDIDQVLDLWRGIITSRFTVFGQHLVVTTVCHPDRDIIAVRVTGSSARLDGVEIQLRFPYGSPAGSGVDWDHPESHTSTLHLNGLRNGGFIKRCLDDTEYYVALQGSVGSIEFSSTDQHLFRYVPDTTHHEIELVCHFALDAPNQPLPTYDHVCNLSTAHWERFWTDGAAVELINSRDVRAFELERRILLSQYLTAVHSSGSLPPQESGYFHNSWAGKFHLEMHWWHSTHFALWNRTQLLEKSIAWYQEILPRARALAKSQGYEGARWPKCTTRDGINAPCYIEPFLIWQQPHPIYFAELIYRHRQDTKTLEKYRDLVFESADFMASFVEWDAELRRFVLGPPLAPAQEIYDHAKTVNPAYELAYWSYGLEVAQNWRRRLGMERHEKWENILHNLSPLPARDGLYVGSETDPETFIIPGLVRDHPTMVAPLGMLPGRQVNREMMRETLHTIRDAWDWPSTWGWDYSMLAMTAARLGEGHLAVDFLLLDSDKNRYLPNGINFQNDRLPVYLPGNGGLLAAIAMMSAGWDDCPDLNAPGFPTDGSWTVLHEGLLRMP